MICFMRGKKRTVIIEEGERDELGRSYLIRIYIDSILTSSEHLSVQQGRVAVFRERQVFCSDAFVASGIVSCLGGHHTVGVVELRGVDETVDRQRGEKSRKEKMVRERCKYGGRFRLFRIL